MKKRKILFGIIAAILMFGTYAVSAQDPDQGLKFLGPDNLAGRSRTVVIDKLAQGDDVVLYTAGVAGGLFKSENGGKTWTSIPYINANGVEEVLPISCMVQIPNGNLVIGTGEGLSISDLDSKGLIIPEGKGYYVYNPENNTFVAIEAELSEGWNYANKMVASDNSVFVATNGGLMRINFATLASTVIFDGGKVQGLEISGNTLYFTVGAKVYAVRNCESSVDFKEVYTNASATASRIEIAVAPSDSSYIYMTVADEEGLLEGVYMTNEAMVDTTLEIADAEAVDVLFCEWTKISTSTVTLFRTYNGWYSNTLEVSPTDPRKLYLGGSDIWVAEGLEGTSIYTWSQSTYSTMGRPSAYYVHENIHAIEFLNDSVYYIATDGGIFKYGEIYDGIAIVGASSIGYSELNKGLTTTQFVSVAVANDGSVFGGAIGHAMPYIKSREDSDITIPMEDSVNHSAESMWQGDGSWGAASMIHQVAPTEKEVLFVGSEGANYGRATSDYFNSTNTQTWTTGSNFNSTLFTTSTYNPAMILWENLNDSLIADTYTFNLIPPFVVRRDTIDTVAYAGFEIMAGDIVKLRDQAHTDYPIEYTFSEAMTVPATGGIQGSIKNPYQSRLFVTAVQQQYSGEYFSKVFMTSNATDFRKVGGNDAATGINWLEVANLRQSVVRALAITDNGDCLFAGATTPDGGSIVVRVRNLATVDPTVSGIFTPNGPNQETVIDTVLTVAAGRVSSISVSSQTGNVLVTLKGETEGDNLYYIENATTADQPVVSSKTIANVELHYSLIEKTSDAIFLGTSDGIYKMDNFSATESFYGLKGVTVSFIKQQTADLKFKRATYYTGTNSTEYRFGKTKYPNAIYFATYGRGIYVDKTYVTDNANEIGIEEVVAENINDVRIYPNPAASYTNIELEVAQATNASIRVFDMSGKMVYTKSLNLTEGVHVETINCNKLQKGVYLINVVTESQMMTSKLVVK